ncbi:mechanosensitive ion channel family protein [Rhodothermus marinus]|uniref:mechanosensitive ion channel family protein n=1 Tax=Rhodothermus marinus TaxID=29549 RepID=UPI0037C88053
MLQTVTADTTQTLTDRLRADSLEVVQTLSAFWTELRNPNLWMGLLGTLLHIGLVVLLILIGLRVIDRAADRWMQRVADLPASHPRRQRASTLANLISSTARYTLWAVGLIMILSELGINVSALLATAGVAGLAIGFGAQTLVRDVISGVFLLFDDTIHVGDLVRVGNDVGTVEHIGVRLIKVRKFDGELLMIPAGELRIFGNRSIGFVRAIVEIGLAYEQDLDTILPVIERVASEWAQAHRDILLEEKPEVQAIMSFGDSAVTVRVAVQVRPGEQFKAERDLRLRLKRTFDELGIEIPFPRRTIYVREEKELPPRRIQDVTSEKVTFDKEPPETD